MGKINHKIFKYKIYLGKKYFDYYLKLWNFLVFERNVAQKNDGNTFIIIVLILVLGSCRKIIYLKISLTPLYESGDIQGT
jgi:hypothetical protein